MKYTEEVEVKVIWTDGISENQKNDFLKVQKEVFDNDISIQKFNRKYIENIYGASLISLAYISDKCVGARAFWRNDINGMKAFQPCDTAVVSNCRGKGIFSRLTIEAMKAIGEDTFTYNFPNDNSLPGYLKLGWVLHERKRYILFNYATENCYIDTIEDKYIEWIVSGIGKELNEYLFFTNIRGKNYLLTKRKLNFYVIIGQLDNKYTSNFQKAKFPICLCYSRKGKIGRGIVTVVRNSVSKVVIPIYKMDTIFK